MVEKVDMYKPKNNNIMEAILILDKNDGNGLNYIRFTSKQGMMEYINDKKLGEDIVEAFAILHPIKIEATETLVTTYKIIE